MASNKRVDVTLGFTADTNKIKKQLQDLQKQLNSLITSPTQNPIGISKEIEQASVAAATLKTQLENATNVDTGMLDLGKFTRSLKQSGYELKDYKAALSKLGLEGNKAFTSLAKSIICLVPFDLVSQKAIKAPFSSLAYLAISAFRI